MKKANKGKVGIILALAAALSCGSAVAVSEICSKADNGVVIAAAETNTEVSARSMTAEQIAAAWNTAVQESIDTGKQVTFTLEDNWTAPANGSSTSFGTGTGFSNGRILVPEGANIILDLNGHTVDRGLNGKTAVENGGVISVAGTLEITDGSSSNGVITGGNTTVNGGGIYVDGGGMLTLSSGKITGNISNYGGGVYVSGGTFNMLGGTVSNSYGIYGGGIYIDSNSTFNMSGGDITGNSVEGGGSAIYACNNTVVTISDGTISGNTVDHDRGCIFISDNSVFTLNGGTISTNNDYVYILGGTFVMNGGMVSENSGGNVCIKTVYVGQGQYHYATFTMNGGKIIGGSGGAGVSIDEESTFNLNGGEISGNTASGVSVTGNAILNLSGGVIFGNSNSAGYTSNLCLTSSALINITGRLPSSTHIGINGESAKTLTSGYTSSGNKIGREASYFISDNDDYVISNNGTEVTLVAASSSDERSTVDWSYVSHNASFGVIEEVEIGENVFEATATYTGGPFVFEAITNGTATATDESGRTVTNFVNVGKYYLNVKYQNAGNYVNPFFTFEILPADFGTADVTVKADPVVYTGSALSTSVKVFLSGTMLELNKDYTVSYENNVAAGEGTVVINAMGNYTGTYSGTFAIEKAKLGVRWGVTTLTYSGAAQGLTVYPEGLKGSDEVTLNVTYYDLDGNECQPVDIGKYKAVVSIEDDNYEFTMPYETYFFIEAKKVDVVWSNTEFVYNGEEQELTAYFVDSEGSEVELTVTAGDLTNAGKGTATAALPESGYENYVLTDNTVSVTYTIAQAEVEAEWSEYEFKYDGDAKEIEVTLNGLNDEDLSGDVTYTYYDADGNEVTPVDAGVYTVVIAYSNNNYKLVGKTEDTFVITKAELVVTLNEDFNGEYDGAGKSPLVSVEDEYGTALDYTVTYAKVDASGNVLENLGATLPVNAGKYVLTVEVDDANVDQASYKAEFEITAKTITVNWNFSDNAMEIDGVYTYLYNGTAQQPKATAEGMQLTVTGTGKSVGNGYKAVASIGNANYVLDGELEVTFNIIKSKVVSVLWYEYGATEPLEEGVTPSYEYISVFGQEDGARLSAYGVLTAADENIVWSSGEQSLIKLNVTYDKFSEGFWTEIGTYSAYASLSSADKAGYSCYMPLGINDTLEFEVTNITHSASVAQILWVVVVDGKHVPAKDYKFIYNGEAQTPVAIRILSNSYDPYDPDEETFEFLTVGGAQTNAGTHYAYIIPEGNYEIKDEDSECKFVIAPLEVEIEWEGVNDDGEIVFTYNGEMQAPKANVVGDNELGCEITVGGFVESGSYTAKAEVGNNFTVKGDNTIAFVIAQYKISTSDIVWEGEGAEERTGSDGAIYFVWQYDGATHIPTATLKIKLDEEGEEIEITLAVTGGASAGGTHYAYATLESSDPANANFAMDVARIRFDIVQKSITVVWDDEENGEIVYTYDGEAHTPTAYYLDDKGERVELNVVGSGTDAGKYVAFITDDIDITNGATKVFTIKAQQLTAEWDRTELSYSGEERTPTVTFYSVETDEDGNPVAVTLKLGEDYTVSGYTNAGSYTSEITLINGNYELTDGATHAFTITKKSVTIIWYGVDGSEEDFAWNYDGEEHVPTFEASVSGLEIIIRGAETQVGTYTAVAILDNDNYTINNPECEFTIKGNAISIIWVGNEDGEFTWEYDGNEHAPEAYIALEDGSKGGKLNVVGIGIYAGEYTVKAILPANCSWSDDETGEHAFTISKKVVYGIIWTGVDGSDENFDWEYDGKYHAPQAQIRSTGEVLTVLGAAVNVSGKDAKYTATAVLANSENYEFAEGVESTIEFTIHARTVNVTWKGVDGSLTNFNWAHDGKVHAPTAVFTDVNGEEVSIPVIGGTASGGQHVAKLMDVFENYDFVEAKAEQPFSITEINASVEWTDGVEGEDGSITFTYEYNGKAHYPVATAKDGDNAEIALTYVIKDASGKATVIIDAGTYTVTVTPSDKNYKLTEGEVTVTVIVEPKKVEIQWGNKTLTENGAAQAPEAWFVDVTGQKIGLTVEGAGVEVNEYTATVTSEFANYELTGDKEVTFNIVKDTSTEYVWVWGEDGVGKWQAVNEETDPDAGDGSQTPEVPPVTPPTDPDAGDGEGGSNGGDETNPTDPPASGDGNGSAGGDGGSGEGEGSTPTEPETPTPDPADGDNTATDPNAGSKNDCEEDEDGTDPDENA